MRTIRIFLLASTLLVSIIATTVSGAAVGFRTTSSSGAIMAPGKGEVAGHQFSSTSVVATGGGSARLGRLLNRRWNDDDCCENDGCEDDCCEDDCCEDDCCEDDCGEDNCCEDDCRGDDCCEDNCCDEDDCCEDDCCEDDCCENDCDDERCDDDYC
ncbi:MAG: hypothetical protein J3R72DRAFT_420157 [Linnemannia gamsii]|nr:MAG: hypothetical protein J3R72DRAFT_420157 [Linnemannia gamsii]